MEKKEARGNIWYGIALVAVALSMVAIAFIWAAFYLWGGHG